MICSPCKDGRHEECPNKRADDKDKLPTGLTETNNAIQRSGLCPCQHKVSE